MAYHREHHIDTKIVRIFNTYGPRMRLHDGRVVPAFHQPGLAEQTGHCFWPGQHRRAVFVTAPI